MILADDWQVKLCYRYNDRHVHEGFGAEVITVPSNRVRIELQKAMTLCVPSFLINVMDGLNDRRVRLPANCNIFCVCDGNPRPNYDFGQLSRFLTGLSGCGNRPS